MFNNDNSNSGWDYLCSIVIIVTQVETIYVQ